jgi:alkyl hydroperoxide reductase subunit AhpC
MSVDPKFHQTLDEEIGLTQSIKLNFPLILDPDFKVMKLYGMKHMMQD